MRASEVVLSEVGPPSFNNSRGTMKKNQSILRCVDPFGSDWISAQRRARDRRSVGMRSLPVPMTGKHQIHKVPFLRVGGASCSAR